MVSLMVGPPVIIDGQMVPDRTLTVNTVGIRVTLEQEKKTQDTNMAMHREHTHNIHPTAQVTQFRFWLMEKLQKLLLILAVHKHWVIRV